MNPTEEEIEQATERLTDYANKIGRGEELEPEEDYLEVDVEGGRIWVHPDEDGTTVDVHLFDDTDDRDFGSARALIIHHLTDIGFRDPHTPFIGSERMNIRVDFSEL